MAVTDAYVTTAQYRASINRSDAGADADILADLTAVSRYLDKRLGRHFTVDVANVARVFTPIGSDRLRAPAGAGMPLGWAETENPWRAIGAQRVLHIDDLSAAPASIKLDEDQDGAFEVTLATTDYELLPRNAPLGSEARPYTAIELTPWGTRWSWLPGVRVQVTGRWGWPAVPPAIQRATIQITAILRLESPRATRQVTALGDTIATSTAANEIVQELVRHYASPRRFI